MKLSEDSEDSVTSQYRENKINKGETGVMRLLRDSQDTQPVLGRSKTQQNHNMSYWIYLPLPLFPTVISISLALLSLPLSLSLPPLFCSLTVTWDCQTESETSGQTVQWSPQKHGGVVPNFKWSCRARRQLLTSQQKHDSHLSLVILISVSLIHSRYSEL